MRGYLPNDIHVKLHASILNNRQYCIKLNMVRLYAASNLNCNFNARQNIHSLEHHSFTGIVVSLQVISLHKQSRFRATRRNSFRYTRTKSFRHAMNV